MDLKSWRKTVIISTHLVAYEKLLIHRSNPSRANLTKDFQFEEYIWLKFLAKKYPGKGNIWTIRSRTSSDLAFV